MDSEVVVTAKELEAEELEAVREREMKTKEGEEVRYVEEVSKSGESDSEGEKNSGSTLRVSSDDTTEVSEEGTEVLSNKDQGEDEKKGEVNQEKVEGDEDDIEIIGEGKQEAGEDGRAERGRRRFSRRLAGIPASGDALPERGAEEQMQSDPSDAEEEKEEVPLKRRTRSALTEPVALATTEVVPTPDYAEEEPASKEEDDKTSQTDQEGEDEEDTPSRAG